MCSTVCPVYARHKNTRLIFLLLLFLQVTVSVPVSVPMPLAHRSVSVFFPASAVFLSPLQIQQRSRFCSFGVCLYLFRASHI